MTERRLGFLRATGPFAHPILAGVCLSSLFALYAYSGLRKWPFLLGITVPITAIFSFSSAAILGLILAFGLLFTDALQRMVTFLSWRLIIPIIAGALLLLELVLENGVLAYLGQFTLNPLTAVYRSLIFEFGFASIVNHPGFGIGFEEYERPGWMIKSTVDNHWLLLGMRHGALPMVLQLAVVIAAIYKLSVASVRLPEIERKFRVGLAISLAVIAILGFSVSFFGGVLAWFYMMLAIAVSVGTSQMTRLRLPQQRGPRPARDLPGKAPPIE